MELSQDMIIDLTLNIAGYLLAGCLSILLYTVFTRDKKVLQKKNSPAVEPSQELAPKVSAPVREVVRQAIQDVKTELPLDTDSHFMRFGQPAQGRNTASRAVNRSSAGQTMNGKRDRAHIIRVATEMMKAGASTDKIKGVIPVTDAELALLNLAKLN